MLRVVERLRCPGDTIAHTLAAAAMESLREAACAGDDRRAANDLLAADALLTYAIEAATEMGTDQLEGLLGELDIARFETMMREAL